MGHRRSSSVQHTYHVQERLHRWADALLGLYFVEVVRHFCIAGIHIVNKIR
jgi:hypothetical protein